MDLMRFMQTVHDELLGTVMSNHSVADDDDVLFHGHLSVL